MLSLYFVNLIPSHMSILMQHNFLFSWLCTSRSSTNIIIQTACIMCKITVPYVKCSLKRRLFTNCSLGYENLNLFSYLVLRWPYEFYWMSMEYLCVLGRENHFLRCILIFYAFSLSLFVYPSICKTFFFFCNLFCLNIKPGKLLFFPFCCMSCIDAIVFMMK